MIMAAIVIMGTAVILVDSQRGWQNMFGYAYDPNTVAGAQAAKIMFDNYVRKSSKQHIDIALSGESVEVRYYSNWNAATLDRFARFYRSGNNLMLETGPYPKTTSSTVDTITICSGVTSCKFFNIGASVQMILTVNDGRRTATVTTSAVRYN